MKGQYCKGGVFRYLLVPVMMQPSDQDLHSTLSPAHTSSFTTATVMPRGSRPIARQNRDTCSQSQVSIEVIWTNQSSVFNSILVGAGLFGIL